MTDTKPDALTKMEELDGSICFGEKANLLIGDVVYVKVDEDTLALFRVAGDFLCLPLGSFTLTEHVPPALRDLIAKRMCEVIGGILGNGGKHTDV